MSRASSRRLPIVVVACAVVAAIYLTSGVAPAAAQPHNDATAKKLRKLQTATYSAQGKSYYAAKRNGEKWLKFARKKRGKRHPDTVMAMQALAGIYSALGSHARAEKMYRTILAIAERAEGPQSLKAAGAIDGLASSFWSRQRLDEADRLFARSFKIYEKHWGAESELIAGMLGRQAGFLQARYMFAAAEQVYHEQIRIYRKADPNSQSALGVQMSLGMLYGRQGEMGKAKKAFDKLLRGYEKKFGKDDTASLPHYYSSVATMYHLWGKQTWALKLLKRAEKLYRKELKAKLADSKAHPSLIFMARYQLAGVLNRQGKFDEAAHLYEKIKAVQEAEHGKGSLQASSAIHPLIEIYKERGDFKSARRILKEWAKGYAKAFGGYTATAPLIMLSDLERISGNFKEAKRLAIKVRRAAAKHWGKNNINTLRFNETIAGHELGLGNGKAAFKLLRPAYAAEKKAIALKMASGTENDNRTYLGERRHQLHTAVTLHAQYLPKDKKAVRFGLDTVLVHKGRLLDASAASVGSLRKRLSKKDRKLLDQLAAAQSELAQLVIAGPEATNNDKAEYAKEITRLERLVRKLQVKVRSRSAVFRASEQPVDLEKIQKAIPASAALVEIVAYRRIDPKARGVLPPGGNRYGAYVMTRSKGPAFVDLGASKRIDKAVDRLRRELSSASGDDYDKYGKQLYNLVFAKVEPLLGGKKFVLLAPDGALNLLPFATLVDNNDRFLVERYNFSYLSSSRELLRVAVKIKAKDSAVIFADPNFDEGGGSSGKSKSRGLTTRRLRSVKWKKLPGTAREAKAIAKLVSGAALYDGARATESKLKTIKAPRILHLATHGFFLPSEKKKATEEPEAGNGPQPPVKTTVQTPSLGSGQDNPLLRSGLALAGANKLRSGREDGVLTALEASGLDLWGTKLVVLSACETGVGEVAQGEGVYGLRRALVMAGAESMLMSLWQVDDDATKELMTGYYKRLQKGNGRSEALRLIQLRMLRSEKHTHPYYWASFIPSGDWAPMK